jgi:hypothetical protein
MILVQAGYGVTGVIQALGRFGMCGCEAGNLIMHLLVDKLH